MGLEEKGFFPENEKGGAIGFSERVLEIIKLENSLPERERRTEEEEKQWALLQERKRELSLEEQKSLKDFTCKKIHYFSQAALRYKSLMRIFKEQGHILGRENKNWWAVARHSLVVALVATELAQALNRKGEARIDENLVQYAALLHDLTKRFEYSIEAKKFEEEGRGDRFDYADQVMDEIFSKPEVVEQLNKFVADPQKLKTIAQSAGVQVAKRGSALQTIEEKIIYLADKYVKHSALVTLEERRRDVASRYTHDLVETEYDYAAQIEGEFAAILGIPREQMIDFLQGLIIARIARQQI